MEQSKPIAEDSGSVDSECIILSKQGSATLDSVNKEYNAIEFRVDMFLHKLWTEWTHHEFTPNELVKAYLGNDIPESQYDTQEIILQNIDFYKDCISRAMGVIRTLCDIPVIYTVRTIIDGGFLDTKNNTDFELYNSLVMFGICDMNCSFIDIEFHYEHNIEGIKELIENCTNSLIIMSKHFIKHENIHQHKQLFYSLKIYEKSFDILKVISSFDNLDDFNIANNLFKENKYSNPKIHINLGEKLKITRVLNNYMLPVACPEICKTSTAPGQMTKQEVVQVREMLGFDSHKKRMFYLLGCPIKFSPSPTFHNKVFELLGMPDKYKKCETEDLEWALYMINKEHTMGCSVTIPLKTELYEQFKEHASEDAKYIQAINTIVKVGNNIQVYNTDWMAVHKLVKDKICNVKNRQQKVLVIGAGGTSLAAIYAIMKLDLVPIIYNRKQSFESNMKFMKELWKHNTTPQFCPDLSLFTKINDFSIFDKLIKNEDSKNIDVLIETVLKDDQVGLGVDVIISWIPGQAQFKFEENCIDTILNHDRNVVVYDASYIPKETELLKQARSQNWQIIKGIDMLIEQAWEQAKLFTGLSSFTSEVRESVESSVTEYYDSLDF